MSVTTHLNRRTALTVLTALAMVVLVLGIQLARPSEEQNEFAPSFKLVAELGETVEMREGTLTLTRLRVASEALQTGGLTAERVKTNAYWLLVDYEFVQRRKSEGMGVELYTVDNTEYQASGRPGSTSTVTRIYAEPGFDTSGVIAFELPKDALPGARLVIDNGSAYGLPLWDHQAVIELGIDQAKADRLVKDAPAVIELKG